MPRDIGTRTGVNETVGFGAPSRAKFCSSSGTWRCPPPTPYALAEPISSAPSRCGFSALPAPEGPDAATATTSVPVDQARGERGQQGQGDRGRVAARDGDPSGAGQHARADRGVRAARTARCRRARCRRTRATDRDRSADGRHRRRSRARPARARRRPPPTCRAAGRGSTTSCPARLSGGRRRDRSVGQRGEVLVVGEQSVSRARTRRSVPRSPPPGGPAAAEATHRRRIRWPPPPRPEMRHENDYAVPGMNIPTRARLARSNLGYHAGRASNRRGHQPSPRSPGRSGAAEPGRPSALPRPSTSWPTSTGTSC